MSKKDVFDTIVGVVLSFGLLAAGYYAGSKKAVKTFGDLSDRQDSIEARMHVLELRQACKEEVEG